MRWAALVVTLLCSTGCSVLGSMMHDLLSWPAYLLATVMLWDGVRQVGEMMKVWEAEGS